MYKKKLNRISIMLLCCFSVALLAGCDDTFVESYDTASQTTAGENPVTENSTESEGSTAVSESEESVEGQSENE